MGIQCIPFRQITYIAVSILTMVHSLKKERDLIILARYMLGIQVSGAIEPGIDIHILVVTGVRVPVKCCLGTLPAAP